jgi:hypothetical protein
MTDQDKVMIDAILEAGGIVAEHGPGIVVRRPVVSQGYSMGMNGLPTKEHFTTLREGMNRFGEKLPDGDRLRVRGTVVEDYAATSSVFSANFRAVSNIDSMTDCRAPNPYDFESLGDL